MQNYCILVRIEYPTRTEKLKGKYILRTSQIGLTMIAIVTLAVLALIAMATLMSLGRLAIRETRRRPQQTNFQQRYIRDSHERSQWQLFTIALGAGTLSQLQESLK